MTTWTDDEVGGSVWSEDEAAGTALGAATGSSLVGFVQSGTGVATNVQDYLRSIKIVLGWIPTNLWAGILAGTNTTDLATYIQNAINDLHDLPHGGTLIFPNGLYVTSQLTLKYKVSLAGWSPARSVAGTAVLHLANSTNAPLIVNDQTNGPSKGTGIDGGTQRSQISTIKNLALRGNSANQTSIDADVLRFTNAWYINIEGCLIVSAKGFGIRALDCNVLRIENCTGFDAPIFWESVADSRIIDAEWGGGGGPVYPIFWMVEANCWKNTFTDLWLYNNSNNLGITQPTFTSDSGGTSHILTTNAAHGWTDKTPVVVSNSGGALPTGLSANVVYYAKILSTTTVRLATSRANLDAGTFVNVSGAGSGTNTIGVGRNCGYYATTGVKRNTFKGLRLDQNYGHGAILGGCTEFSFGAFEVAENGLANVTGVSGFKLESATKIKFGEGSIDGTTVTVGASNSNQTIGIEADSGSTQLSIAGVPAQDHSTADIQAAAGYTASITTDEIFIPYTMFTAAGGTSPAVSDYASARRNAFMFAAAGTEIAEAMVAVPKGCEGWTPTVVWINDGAGAGDVVWRVQCLARVAGESFNSADDTGDSGGDPFTAGAQDIAVVSQLGTNLTAIDQGDYASVRISRLGDEAADTLANDAGFVGVKLTRA